MLTKREKLLVFPWQKKRFEEHRRKIKSAKPVVDDNSPTNHNHVLKKWKKQQKEKERQDAIERENIRLLQSLGRIMKSKRIEDIWIQPRPNFLNREVLYDSKSHQVPREKEQSQSSGLDWKEVRGSSKRCLVCTGRYVKKSQVIPEPRIPWEPIQTTCNVKLLTAKQSAQKCCRYCCNPIIK